MPRDPKPAQIDTEGLPELNERQAAYVEARFAGKNQSDAYREAYQPEPGTKPAAIWRRASEIESNPKVRRWINAIPMILADRVSVTLESHIAELRRIGEEARAAGNYGAAVKAEELRGKATGLYVDQRLDLTPQRDADPETYLADLAEKHSVQVALLAAKSLGRKYQDAAARLFTGRAITTKH